MKLIIKNWRMYLSEGEGMKTVGNLPEGIGVTIEEDPYAGDGGQVLVYYSKLSAPNEFIGWGSGIQGEIRLEPVQLSDEYPCSGSWMVAYSDATKGWGPMLYDVAMEYATLMGGGLMSDRTIVSDEAYAVWDYYLKNRKDVAKGQTDNEQDSFKNGRQDDCLQNSTHDYAHKTQNSWIKNPLSKLYSKEPTTIDALGDRLVTIGFERWTLGG